MPHKGKSSFTSKTHKIASFLRTGLRILFLLIFVHWILWLTSYANCANYQEAINEKNVREEEKKLKEYDSKTDQYWRFTGWLNKKRGKEEDIKGIEEEVLSQIEKKREKELGDKKLPREWEKHFDELERLSKEKKKLEDKENKNSTEEAELKKKQEEYKKNLQKAKDETVKNIDNQLKENKLSITELDDGRSLSERILYDPLKFVVISPLNWFGKISGINNYLFLEIIFKLLIIEIILVLVYYSETIVMWENMEKARDPHLSVEEREQLNLEASSLFKYALFNGCMMMLFNIFLFFHPAFFDRTRPSFQTGTPGTAWYYWIFPIFFSVLLSSISAEFLRHGRLLTKTELKVFLAKNWVFSLLMTLAMMGLMRAFGMSNIGSHLFFLLGGLVRFAINTIRAKFFGHREYFPSSVEHKRTGAPYSRY